MSNHSPPEDFAPSGRPDAFGHHFLIGLQRAPVLTDHDKRLLSQLRPAGIILFADNFLRDRPYELWLEAWKLLLHDARQAIGRDRILVCIDHEGGRVHRPPPPITHFASPRAWRERAAEVGAAMGRELRSLGVNLDFAPLLDVNSNSANPVIGDRAFGATPDEVIAPARAFLRALQAEGVLSCPKHFPGYGDVELDSHYGLPILELTCAELRTRELLPFAAMVGPETRLIMTAHILFPQIDPDWPATVSPRFVRDILRGELGFTGVVVTDDLGMGAVAALFDRETVAARTVAAGTDLLEYCAYWNDTGRALQAAGDILAGLKGGLLTETELQRSHARVAALLAEVPQHPVTALSDAILLADREAGPTMAAESPLPKDSTA
jgi:beta-N-acetylhexosaminidase